MPCPCKTEIMKEKIATLNATISHLKELRDELAASVAKDSNHDKEHCCVKKDEAKRAANDEFARICTQETTFWTYELIEAQSAGDGSKQRVRVSLRPEIGGPGIDEVATSALPAVLLPDWYLGRYAVYSPHLKPGGEQLHWDTPKAKHIIALEIERAMQIAKGPKDKGADCFISAQSYAHVTDPDYKCSHKWIQVMVELQATKTICRAHVRFQKVDKFAVAFFIFHPRHHASWYESAIRY